MVLGTSSSVMGFATSLGYFTGKGEYERSILTGATLERKIGEMCILARGKIAINAKMLKANDETYGQFNQFGFGIQN